MFGQGDECNVELLNGDEYMTYKRKLLFRFFDTNRNNVLELEDLLSCCRSLSKNVGESDSNLMMAPFVELWNKLTTILEVPEAQALSLDQWLHAVDQIHKDDWYREVFIPTMSTRLFDSIDSNRDGQITFNEWRSFQNKRGVTDEEVIKNAFTKLDLDRDGLVTREEFSNAFYQFGNGRDPKNDYSFIYKIK